MKKEKIFDRMQFPAETIRTATKLVKEIDSRSENSDTRGKVYTRYVVHQEGGESTTFDHEEEFFAAYRQSFSRALYSVSHAWGSHALDLVASPGSTTVTVAAPSHVELERVFAIFEDVYQSYKLEGKCEVVVRPKVPVFNVTHDLPATIVSIDLVSKLEYLLLSESQRLFSISETEVKEHYSVTLVDGSGTETLSSMDRYVGDVFPDTTEEITISLHMSYFRSKSVDIALKFHKTRRLTYALLHIGSDNARADVATLWYGITRCIEPNRTIHWLFNLPFGVAIAIVSATCVSAFLIIASPLHHPVLLDTFFFLMISITISWRVVAKVKPYTAFDSRLQARHDRWCTWFGCSLLAFLIFGTILTALRKRLVGF